MRKTKIFEKNMIIFFIVFSFVFTLFPVSAKAKEVVSISSTYSHEFDTTYYANISSYYYHEGEFPEITSFFNELPSDRFYKIEYSTIINFTSDATVSFSSLNLNIDLPLFGDTYTCNIYDFDSLKHISGYVQSFETTQNGYFILQNYDNFSEGLPFDFSLSYAPSVLRSIANNVEIQFNIHSIEELTESEIEIYQRAYEDGFDVGILQGYRDGMSEGQQLGYNQGYEDGYNIAFGDGYDQGLNDGIAAVDRGQIYQQGFKDGAASVDTDSFYQAGYQAGLSTGYDEAYENGKEAGYKQGYVEAFESVKNETLDKLQSSGTTEGEQTTVVHDLSIKDTSLSYSESNTTLPSVYEYEYDEEYRLLDGAQYSDGEMLFDTIKQSDTYLNAYAYHYAGAKKLFTADPSAYAYKIDVQLSNTTYSATNVLWARNTIGTWSDIMSGESELGLGFSNGSAGSFSYYYVTDNLPVDIYSAVLFYYKDTYLNSASYDLKSKLTFKITPYSRNEYAAMMENMDQNFDDLEDALAKEFEDLKEGYENEQGDQASDDLEGSLDDMSEAEDSLFNDSTGSLDSFEFFDFNSVPAMMTGITFVTATMTSVYNGMGGNSGIGIILSVLFSVMLISICLGIYKRYQSKG